MSHDLQSLFVVGSSHHDTPIEVRERFALEPAEAAGVQQALRGVDGIRECLVLNTCNRLEVYAMADDPGAGDRIKALLCERRGIDPALFDRYAFQLRNLDAIQHAAEVSAGLDSQMVGETDILGQVKDAYLAARESGATGRVLNRLFERCFMAAKAARSQTAITRGQVSIGAVAAGLAGRIFDRLDRCRVLLLGSGDVAEKTATALAGRGAGDITVSSRTYDNAKQLAHRFAGAAIDFADFKRQLPHFDIVIGSTASPDRILGAGEVAPLVKQRHGRPLFLLDLAVPRDFDPAAARLDAVFLYNLDDLSTIANENLEARKAEISRARTILERHAWSLWLQLRRRASPVAETLEKAETAARAQ